MNSVHAIDTAKTPSIEDTHNASLAGPSHALPAQSDELPGIPAPGVSEKTVKRKRRLSKDALCNLGWFVLAWLIIVALWEICAATGLLNPHILPPPSETLPYLFSGSASVGFGVQKSSLFESSLITMARIFGGLLLGISLAMVVSILVIEVRVVRRLVMPIVQTLAPVAPVAWIPFAIAIVGVGVPAAIFVVVMAIFSSVTISAVAAFDGVPQEYIKVAQTLGTSRQRLWRHVLLPAAAPSILTMLRMSLFGAWMAVLAGEMAGINSGLGYLVITGQQMFNMKLVMVGVLTIGLLGFAMDRLMLWMQGHIIWWQRNG